MPAPICATCQIEMICKQNDKLVNDVRAANFPSTYWLGDLFECPVCHSGIVVGFGREISAEQAAAIGFDTTASMTFAHEPAELQRFAEQFERSEAIDVLRD